MIMARPFNMEIYDRVHYYYKGPKFKRSVSTIKDTSGPVMYHITQNSMFHGDRTFGGNRAVYFFQI